MVQSWDYWLDPTKMRSRKPGNASSWLQVGILENVEFDEKQFGNFSIFRNLGRWSRRWRVSLELFGPLLVVLITRLKALVPDPGQTSCRNEGCNIIPSIAPSRGSRLWQAAGGGGGVALQSVGWGDLDKISLFYRKISFKSQDISACIELDKFYFQKKNIFCLICLIQAWGWLWEGQRLIRNIVQFISLREIRRESWAGLTVIVSVINNLMWIIELFPAACLHGTACWFKIWL